MERVQRSRSVPLLGTAFGVWLLCQLCPEAGAVTVAPDQQAHEVGEETVFYVSGGDYELKVSWEIDGTSGGPVEGEGVIPVPFTGTEPAKYEGVFHVQEKDAEGNWGPVVDVTAEVFYFKVNIVGGGEFEPFNILMPVYDFQEVEQAVQELEAAETAFQNYVQTLPPGQKPTGQQIATMNQIRAQILQARNALQQADLQFTDGAVTKATLSGDFGFELEIPEGDYDFKVSRTDQVLHVDNDDLGYGNTLGTVVLAAVDLEDGGEYTWHNIDDITGPLIVSGNYGHVYLAGTLTYKGVSKSCEVSLQVGGPTEAEVEDQLEELRDAAKEQISDYGVKVLASCAVIGAMAAALVVVGATAPVSMPAIACGLALAGIAGVIAAWWGAKEPALKEEVDNRADEFKDDEAVKLPE